MTNTVKCLFAAMMICSASMASADVVTGYVAQEPVVSQAKSSATGAFSLKVDKIDFRKDLTRVYARIVGKPHTSQRIDGVTLRAGKAQPLKATDIDGIDMDRYFQFEDNGTIAVEIDFPPMNVAKNLVIAIATPLGVYTYKVTNK